jgi:dipeptidyl aminopeptidase/acylaminoacyl peptidase
MRKDVAFKSKGLNCAGWLYVPDNLKPGKKAPAIIMAHGHSAVKEQYLAPFAERFTAAGFVTLVFDYRYWGASEGEPRCQLFPLEQVEDYRNAITWVSELPEVDPGRIGLWGSSYSGGIITYVATFDKRVKALVGQVPAVISLEERRALNPAKWEAVGELLLQDRIKRYPPARSTT